MRDASLTPTADPSEGSADAESVVVGRGLVKSYGRSTVFDGLDFDVPERSLTTLLGPSGCGKTTILRLVGGFEEPDAGTLTLGGRSILGLPPERRSVNTVFQNYALFPHMTVVENVAFPLRVVQQTSAVMERVGRVLELVHMEAYRDSYPARLSGGQQQRVALARAIVAEPLVLLLDEPLSALDRKMRTYLQGEIKRLQRRLDRAFLFVTHDQEEAFALSDLVYVMNAGRILQRGSPEEVYARPADAFVADFIGESSLLPVRIEATDGATAKVDTPLGRLGAPVHPELGRGDKGVLVLRPEAVHVSQETNADLRACVTDVTFTGDGYRIDVDYAGVGLLGNSGRPVEPGSMVGVSFDPAAAYITQEVRD